MTKLPTDYDSLYWFVCDSARECLNLNKNEDRDVALAHTGGAELLMLHDERVEAQQ